MNLLKVASRDLSKIIRSRYFRISIVAIMIIPLLYSLLYLDAFWDPYSRLENVPIAVVNQDKGVENNGYQNYGDDIVDKLKDDHQIGWAFTTYEAAKKSVEEQGGYYAMIVIPENFSANVLSAKTGTPVKPTLQFIENQKKNFIQTQINSKLILELKDSIAKTITEEYALAAFDSLEEIKVGMVEAADGSTQLREGLDEGKDGALKLNEGLMTASEGIQSLEEGGSQLAVGSEKAMTGASQLNDGMNLFMEQGIVPVSQGIHRLSEGLSLSVIPGAAKIEAGSKTLSGGLAEADLAVDQLSVGASAVSEGINTYTQAISASQKALESGTNNYLKAYLSKNPTAMTDPDMQKFMGLLKQLSETSATKEAQSQVAALITGAQTVAKGTAQLATGIESAHMGAVALAEGSSQLYQGINTEFAPGLTQLDQGMPQLKRNGEKLSDASGTLAIGLTELNQGATQLADGVNTLGDGMDQLTIGSKDLVDGMTQLSDGANTLSDELTNGADALTDSLVNDSSTMSSFIGEPILIESTLINPVSNYGKGFAPYFIALALWVGGILLFFIIGEEVDEDIKASAFSRVMGKYLSYMVIGMLQALVVSVVVLNLGLNPSNVGLFILTNLFMSCAFIAMIQFLIFTFKDGGRLLAMIMLILQLTACAGTFPIEVVPSFFKAINGLMPFTYTVSALREVIAGIDYSVLYTDYLVIGGFMIGSLILTVVSNALLSRKKASEKVEGKMILVEE